MTSKEKLKNALIEMRSLAGNNDQLFLSRAEKLKTKISRGLLYEDVSIREAEELIDSIFHEEKYSKDIREKEKNTFRQAKVESEVNLSNEISGNSVLKDREKRQLKKELGLKESVLDPINKVRCPEIFDSNDKIRKSVKEQIFSIVETFVKQCKEAGVEFKIKKIYMIGSSTGFQYSPTSDIDIDLITDLSNEKLQIIYKFIPKGIMLENSDKPFNIFIITKDSSFDFEKCENVFEVRTETWEKKTDAADIKVPFPYILDLSRFFMNGCDLTLSQYERDKRELENAIRLDPNTQEISEREKDEAISKNIIDLKNDLDAMKMAHHVIFSFEQEAYDKYPFKVSIESPETTDPRYSINNLVYKMIDRFGYFDKMRAAIAEGDKIIERAEKEMEANNNDKQR